MFIFWLADSGVGLRRTGPFQGTDVCNAVPGEILRRQTILNWESIRLRDYYTEVLQQELNEIKETEEVYYHIEIHDEIRSKWLFSLFKFSVA